MARSLIGIVLAALTLGAAILVARRVRPQFVIRIQKQRARCVRGEVSERYVRDCNDVAQITGVRSGCIRGFRRAGAVHLVFSRAISGAARQSFRNVWPDGQDAGPRPIPPRGPSGRRARG